jgi:preprotein translocase subunit YajC
MAGIAYAQSTAASPAAGGFASFGQFVPLILIFVVFYFLLIRPQQKKAQEQQSFLGNLQKGDKVMTGGGGSWHDHRSDRYCCHFRNC